MEPNDASARRAVKPVICYPDDTLPKPNLALYQAARASATLVDEITIPPRDARCFTVPEGHFFRISSLNGPQVGDLNLWHAENLSERFYSGKTRALHGTHISTGEQMWSSFSTLRPMATVVEDTLGWYGIDEFGGSVHDVIGTRCDPYTNNLLSVFMCTGFTRDTGQYFMKASPVRPGDYIEFFAEIPLLGALSACPGGDCSAEHSSDTATCHPLLVQVFKPAPDALTGWQPPKISGYNRSHGL